MQCFMISGLEQLLTVIALNFPWKVNLTWILIEFAKIKTNETGVVKP